MTWPDLVNFFYQKLRKVCPIRYPKTLRFWVFFLGGGFSKPKPLWGFFAICEKPQGGGCTNPPPSPGGIFPNSITRVVSASGWPSDWLTLANQRRKTQCGCRGLGSVMCSYCQSHTEDVVAWLALSGEALCYVHLLSVAAYGGHGRVMRSVKAAFSVTLGSIFLNICVKRYRDNEHDEVNT